MERSLEGQVQVQRDRVEAREKPAGEVADDELEDRRPNERGHAGRGADVTGGRGREAEASARDRHLEGLVTQATAEMVHLVDDEKVEATSDLLHVPIRPFEGRDRDRRHLTDAVAIAADRA